MIAVKTRRVLSPIIRSAGRRKFFLAQRDSNSRRVPVAEYYPKVALLTNGNKMLTKEMTRDPDREGVKQISEK